ncbi:MAG: sugar ABC transporter permease [Clostridia bacterium]|nr:sugar ABC transporter permease [Clostridia bacterium]
MQDLRKKSWRTAWYKSFTKYWQLYLLLIPVIAYYVIFKYKPMLGVQIAFRDYKLRRGMWGSEWIGFKHFQRFFSSYWSGVVIRNTLIIGFLSLIFCFPFSICLALIFNELRSQRFKKTMQTITYAPHFVSTIVVVGMMTAMCSPSTGIVNKLLLRLGLVEEPLYFMGSSRYFRFMYIYSALWKDGGWNAIIFISALAAIDPSLYEAATVDGASRLQQLLHVTLPSILPTIVIMLILESGKVLNVGYEKAYAMQNDLNMSVSEVISTYSYKQGLEELQYDYATAIGLFNSVISFAMLITVNAISKRASETSLF